MKKSTIYILIMVAGVVAMLTVIFANSIGGEASFAVAKKNFKKDIKREVQIVGKLKKDDFGETVGFVYNPNENADYYSFILVDKEGNEERVHHYESAPPKDFKKVPSVTLRGFYESESKFKATKITAKCPSKYEEQGVVQE